MANSSGDKHQNVLKILIHNHELPHSKLHCFPEVLDKPSKTSRSKWQAKLTGFLLGLLFDPKDGGDTFLRNVGLSPNYMALHSHRHENLISTKSVKRL
jgi:hypothetical protein